MILKESVDHGFERMCIVYEIFTAMVYFFIYEIMYILLYKCVCVCVCVTLYFYVCKWNIKMRNIKNKLINKTLG